MTQIKLGSIAVGCGSCGSEEMSYDESLGPDSEVCCANCGAFIGTVSGINDLAAMKGPEIIEEVAKRMKSEFKF